MLLSAQVDRGRLLDSVPGGQLPTMLTPQERSLLAQLARHTPAGSAIVDAGSFMGSSTTALVAGLVESDLEDKDGVIWAYDLFRATPMMAANLSWLGGTAVRAGESFRALYDAGLGASSRFVRTWEGDITKQPAPDRPVCIMFLDVLWSFDVSADVTRRFYPRLQAGRSALVHQDFMYPFYPWIPIHMGLMERHFQLAYQVPHSSVVFDVIAKVSPNDVPDPRDVDYKTGIAQIEKFMAKTGGWAQGALGMSAALFAACRSRFDSAFSMMAEVKRRFSGEPLAAQYFGVADGLISAAAQSGRPLDLRGGN